MRGDRYLALVCMPLGLAMVREGLQLGYWVPIVGPGPGFFPLFLGVAWVVLGAFIWAGARTPGQIVEREKLVNVAVGFAALLVTLILVNYVGMLAAMGLFCVFWMKVMGRYGWVRTLSISVGTVLGIFLVFGLWLKIPLPHGIMGW